MGFFWFANIEVEWIGVIILTVYRSEGFVVRLVVECLGFFLH